MVWKSIAVGNWVGRANSAEEEDAVSLAVFVVGADSVLLGRGAKWGRNEEAVAGSRHSEIGVSRVCLGVCEMFLLALQVWIGELLQPYRFSRCLLYSMVKLQAHRIWITGVVAIYDLR